jgi:hypothetical protein
MCNDSNGVNIYNADNVETNIQAIVHVISEVCESAAAQREASDIRGTAQGSDMNGNLVSAQVYAHNTVSGNGNVFVTYENEKQGENSGVTMGSIKHSANREVLFTQVSHTPGEGQSLGDGAQVQLNEVGVTSLSNWGHSNGVTIDHLPCNDKFNILNINGVGLQVFKDYKFCNEILDEVHPEGVNTLGEMSQRSDTTDFSPGSIFGVLPFNELDIYQGPRGKQKFKSTGFVGKKTHR